MDSLAPDPLTTADDIGGSQRSRSRDSLFLMAELCFDGESDVHEARVRNLSEGGLMVDCDRVKDAGTPVILKVRGIGTVEGKVAWCTEGRVGIALDRPIDPKKARKPLAKRQG